jgi:hypothetical protein
VRQQKNDTSESSRSRCAVCPQLDAKIRSLQEELLKSQEANADLLLKARDIDNYAAREVQQSMQLKRLQQQLEDEREKGEAAERMVEILRRSLVEMNEKLFAQEAVKEELARVKGDHGQLLLDVETLHGELTALRNELKQMVSRLERKTADNEQLQKLNDALRLRVQEREATIQKLELREVDIQLKEAESLKLQRIVMEMRERCEQRAVELQRVEEDCHAMAKDIADREKSLEQREDEVNNAERQVRRTELENQERWESVFKKAQVDLEALQQQLLIREAELAQRSAEFRVKEELFDKNLQRAESTSLAERERRLKLLKGIEAQLAAKERQLRTAERGYLAQIIHPELNAANEDRNQLQRKLHTVMVDLERFRHLHQQEIERSAAERKKWIERAKADALSPPKASENSDAEAAEKRMRRKSFLVATPK